MNELMTKTTMMLGLVAALAATGCGDEAADQVIVGRIATATFAEPVTQVRAIGADHTVEVAVAADGTFALSLPVGDRYRFELVAASRRADLVIPRVGGGVGTTVLVAGADAPFVLGDIRYLRDPADQTFDFGDSCEDQAGGPICAGEPGESGGGGQDTGGGGGQDTGGGGGGDTGGGGGGDTGGGGGGDTGGGGGGDSGGGGGQDTGGGGGQDTGGGGQDTGGGGQDTGGGCGVVDDADTTLGEDGAIADHTLPAVIGCDDGAGGGQDTGGGGQDTGSGGGN